MTIYENYRKHEGKKSFLKFKSLRKEGVLCLFSKNGSLQNVIKKKQQENKNFKNYHLQKKTLIDGDHTLT